MKDLEKVRKLSNNQFDKVLKINETIEDFKKNKEYPFVDILSVEGTLIYVDDIQFNISLCFDDIWEEEGIIYAMNLFYADIEEIGNKNIQFIKKNFPTFFKIQKIINKLKKNNDKDYIVIGKNTVETEENLAFKTVEEFEKYLNSFDTVIDYYKDFEKEILKYVKKMKFSIVSDSGIYSVSRNGAYKQEILFKTKNHLYKISIHDESYEEQSYGRLYIKDKNGWTTIKSINPKRDYSISLAYKKYVKENAFEIIIQDFYNLVEKIDDIPTI